MLFHINQTWPDLFVAGGNAFLLSFLILVQGYSRVAVPPPREDN